MDGGLCGSDLRTQQPTEALQKYRLIADDLVGCRPVNSSPKEKKVLDDIKSLDILEMTPLEAMNTLYKLQKKLK